MSQAVEVSCPACGSDRVARRDHRRSDCRRCGCAFSTAFEADASVVAREQQKQLDSGLAGAIAVERHRAPIYATILDRFPPPPNGACLDVGCGAGHFARLAAARGWRAAGVDPVAPSDAPAGVRFVRSGFPESDGQQWFPGRDGSFHLVTFLNTLNFMRDPLVSLREAHRLLAPGGTVVVRVPNEAFHRALGRLGTVVRRVSPARAESILRGTISHPRSFTRTALEIVLARAGFWNAQVEASPASAGDPYALGIRGFEVAKALVSRTTSAIWRLSGRRLVCSSSLLAIGRRSSAANNGASCG